MAKLTRGEFEIRAGRAPDDGWCVNHSLHQLRPGETVYCLHCGGSFTKGTEMVDGQDGMLVCPNGSCHGNPADWSPTPWK